MFIQLREGKMILIHHAKEDSDFPEKDSSGIKWFVSPQQFTYIKRNNRHNHCQNRASTLYNVLICAEVPDKQAQSPSGLDPKWGMTLIAIA